MKDFLKGIVYVGLFAIPLIPLIVTDSMFFPFITGKNFTFRIIVEVVFGAWVLLALLDKMYRPRFSWIWAGTSAFLLVMFFANLFGEYSLKSFWSNFERMDGYVTLVHFYLLFVVLGSTFKDKKIWTYFLYTSIAAASYVAFDGLQQYIDKVGAWRIDSTLGNAAYMAVYMFFHAFFSVWLFMQSKQWWLRSLNALLFALFTYLLLLTATRGTFIGLVGGLGLAGLYLAIFSKAHPFIRKVALGSLVVLALSVGTIFAFKDSEFIAKNPALTRIASISLEKDLALRFDIWGMAFEGFKERPILGWGQGNFNYIFNEKYNPDLYFAESWYDRAHDIVFDWLVAGGILGLLTYMSIFMALLYYLFWRPLFKHNENNDDDYFTVPERAILIGMIAGYFVHNLVVFDNIVSYIFFATVLALIHARVGEEVPKISAFEIDSRIVTNIVAPVMLVCIGTVVYFVNIPGMQASGDIIGALTADTIPQRLELMDRAISRDSFAYQEIVEQLAQQAIQINASPNIPPEQKKPFINRAELELLELEKRKPGDARVQVFIAGFYRSMGTLDKSKTHIDKARGLSPTKQAIILEQGILAYQTQDFESMHSYFKEAFDLQQNYNLARIFYVVSLMYVGQPEKVEEIITEEHFEAFAMNDFALQTADQFGQRDLLVRMFDVRINNQPENPQYRTSKAFLLYQAQDVDGAITVLQEGVDTIPSFAEKGNCYIENLKVGNEPGDGC
ncbi:O-antigen ligase family protein [Candidatus Pacebacteria bacterium]|nr:O-antigen ligase family protein [Candidatus Paceibacterota bacterium]